MARFNDHQPGNNNNKGDVLSVEDGHKIATAFDFTEEDEEEETEFVNLDDDTDHLDILNFVGDLRSLMVEDSEDDVIVLDSDDDDGVSSALQDGSVRGPLWRRVSAVGALSIEVKSSAGSNLTDKVANNGPSSVQADTRNHEVLTGISNNENVAKDVEDQKACCNSFENANEAVNESPEPGESTQDNALRFVDHYLSISVENLSPEVKIRKTNVLRSPTSSFAKGSHSLAKKATLLNRIGNSTFDWDGNQPDHGGEFMLTKEKELNMLQEIHVVRRSFDQRLQEELLNCPQGNDTTDASFNTQMAAEAIQSLFYAAPPTVDVNQNEDMNKKTPKQFSFPLRDVINSNQHLVTKTQKELNVESSTDDLKKVPDKSLKVVNKRKENQGSGKENIRFCYKRRGPLGKTQKVETFSPVASRTRNGSVKVSKKTKNSSNLERITHGKQVDNAVSVDMKFESWNCPKKKRTRRNMKQNAKFSGHRIPVVDPGETETNFREAFFMSTVKRKARSASKFRPTAGKKFWKGSLLQAEVTNNTKLAPMSINSHPLLKDQRVFVTSNVEPNRETIKNLVQASQGQVMETVQQASMEYKISDNLLILSCEKDYEVCVPFLDKGAAVYSSELLLHGITIQKLDYARHQLFKGHVKMKRYARKRMKKGIQHIHGS